MPTEALNRGKWTMQRISMPDELRPFYLDASTDGPHSWEVPQSERWDFELGLYMPRSGDARIDQQIISDFQDYLSGSNWGYEVVSILRESPECGGGAVHQLVFRVRDLHKEAAEANDQQRPSVTQLNVLRQLANVKYMAAGTAALEELHVDSTVIAYKATLTTTDGTLDNVPAEITDGDRRFVITRVNSTVLSSFVQGVGDTDDDPVHTANWLANKLGLFLPRPIGEPKRIELHRGSKLCRSAD